MKIKDFSQPGNFTQFLTTAFYVIILNFIFNPVIENKIWENN